ncbi:protein of unknown function [Ruminococcaceae bacterium BL-4]|nr:protein of unknown function [Ruminococcaceae bacterium BL-4]
MEEISCDGVVEEDKIAALFDGEVCSEHPVKIAIKSTIVVLLVSHFCFILFFFLILLILILS